jgi:MFS transporter, DHA1 family, multidrug resistance protein
VSRFRRVVRHNALLRGLPGEVAALTAVAFCVALGFGIVAPAIPVFAREFGVSMVAASAVISAFALMRFIGAPIAGWLVNRSGERFILVTGLLIVAVSSIAAGLAQTYTELVVLRAAGGIGSAMFTVSATTLLLRVVDDDMRGRAAGAFSGGFLIGGITGPAIGGLVIAWSIRAPFFVYGVTLFAAALVGFLALRKAHLREREQEVSHGEADETTTLRQALAEPAYRAALAVNLVTGFVTFGLRASIIPIFITEGLARSASLTGYAFLVAAGMQGLLLLPAGRMADTDGRRKAMLFGTVGLTVGMVVLALTDVAANGWGETSLIATMLLLLSLAIQGAASAYLSSAPSAVVGDIVGGRRGGVVVSAFSMTSDFGAILGPLVAGLLVASLDFDWAFAAGSVLCAVAVILVIVMPETLRRPPNPA